MDKFVVVLGGDSLPQPQYSTVPVGIIAGGGKTPPCFDPKSILQEFCVVITNQRSLGREKNYSMRYGQLKIGPRIGR